MVCPVWHNQLALAALPIQHMQVQPLNPADQLACEGVEVAAGALLLLVHCATAKPLNLEEAAKRPTDFGVELEVSAAAVTSSGKQLALEHAARVSSREVFMRCCWTPGTGQWGRISTMLVRLLQTCSAWKLLAAELHDAAAATTAL
jgi:hypothetical protein